MIILDTNVVSVLMRERPLETVEAWLNRQPRTSVWTTSITVLEARYCIELLPSGRRREQLARKLERVLTDALGGHVLDFGAADGAIAASIMASGRAAGRSIEFRDAMIAGIAATRRAQLATIDVKHFEHTGLDIVDPSSG